MKKKVLILCTGNSCRSIIAQALINAKLKGIIAQSAGVKASKIVHPSAKKILEKNKIWKDEYHSKSLDPIMDEDYDLVVTVCENAKETCPIFPKKVKTLHVGFSDPDGKDFNSFEKTYKDIEEILLPKIADILG